VSGELPLGWSATVASNLTSLGCDVEAARATLDAENGWHGVFEGTRPATLLAVPSSDSLLVSVGNGPAIVPRILTHHVARDGATGRLDLHIRAKDASGLLASFLRNLGMLGLFPQRFDVRTEVGVADDRFSLAGIGGSRVTERSELELGRLLARWSPPPVAKSSVRHA